MNQSMNKYIMEFIGTFFLMFTIGCSGGQALAIGAILMTMIFAGGHISGAHYNPAVTLGVFLRGRCDKKDVGPYMAAQVLAAVVAALVVRTLRPDHGTGMDLNVGRALLVEFLFTFALVFVVLNVATAKGTVGNMFYGLAIGFTVLAGALTVGDISGGAFNPAVAVGVTVLGGFKVWNIWIYLVADFAAGVAAANVFKMLNPHDYP